MPPAPTPTVSTSEQAQQLAAGGHGGLSATELASYRAQQQRWVQAGAERGESIRREALGLAVVVVGKVGSDPLVILDTAHKFEAFLKGGAQAEQG